MTECGSNTLMTTIIQGYNTTVREWQLNLTLTLLAGNFTCDRAVNLIGQPVLAGHSFQLKHALEVFLHLIYTIRNILIFALNGLICHDCLWRMTEHLSHVQVEWLDTIALDKREVGIACGLTDNIHRCTLTLSNLLHVVEMLLVNEQAHALL